MGKFGTKKYQGDPWASGWRLGALRELFSQQIPSPPAVTQAIQGPSFTRFSWNTSCFILPAKPAKVAVGARGQASLSGPSNLLQERQ